VFLLLYFKKKSILNKIHPDFKAPLFKNQLFFEFISWFGRHFKKQKSKIIPGTAPLLVDLGAGENYREEWVHVDFYTLHIKFWKKYKKRKPDIETDLRYPLNCPDNVVDGIYTSHTIEHLYPDQAYRLLYEIFRVLKPACWVRIGVPDLKKCVDFYNGKKMPGFAYNYKAEAISNYTQNWGHHSAWDAELLSKALELIGFINIKEVEFGKEGIDKRLIKEEEVRKFETLVIEAQKP